MRLHLCAVGRLRQGPERVLIDDYLDRFAKTGRALGFGAVQITEVEDKKSSGPAGEAALLRRAIPDGAAIWALDERGAMLSSPEFAQALAQARDLGQGDLAFVIGGADGLAPELRAACARQISFGPMVWPHMLARVMLSEQLYRAASILTGAPYHRA